MYYVTNSTTGTSRLIIKMTLDEDIGTYSVKVTGPQGEETSSAKLIPAGKCPSHYSIDSMLNALVILAQFQNQQKKKVDQVQRKALVQELEEQQLKRMRPSKSNAPRGSLTSYATSDDEVFLDAVSIMIAFMLTRDFQSWMHSQLQTITLTFFVLSFRANAPCRNDIRLRRQSLVRSKMSRSRKVNRSVSRAKSKAFPSPRLASLHSA